MLATDPLFFLDMLENTLFELSSHDATSVSGIDLHRQQHPLMNADLEEILLVPRVSRKTPVCVVHELSKCAVLYSPEEG
jgi:hypothetical protein